MSQMFTHISFYKFVDVDDPQALRLSLKELVVRLNLKGTLILALEGVNGMLAGSHENIQIFINEFQKDIRFLNILFKFNNSQTQPFKRMLIKVKKEILTFKEPQIKPHIKTGKYLKPQELREWLSNNEDIILIDTRNDYEVKEGTFKNALNPEIKNFIHFKTAVKEKYGHLKDKKIVTFCTGGIRCEKASAYMIEQGFKDVYQIEGGILKYFKEVAGEYWEGHCFVFDNRILVDRNLNEVPSKS